MCNEPMTELSNPGASGSVFYITSDDEFIIKTVQHKEAEFLQKLLPGYYMVRRIFFYALFSEPSDIHCKYGAPKQAKHEQIMYLGPFQNKFYSRINFYFYFVLRSNILAYPFCY
jgi:hypothetical protein